MHTLIGIDAAAQRSNAGYALAERTAQGARLTHSGMLDERGGGIAMLAAQLKAGPCLVAIDAPLGWPIGLHQALAAHSAGHPLHVAADGMFRRCSDRRLRSLGHRPLEVGADLIARTAYGALSLLEQLREMSGEPLPLLWAVPTAGSGVIEVYPAATLKAQGLTSKRYKKPNQIEVRRRIAAGLEPRISGLSDRCDRRADEFDACICLIAALDFLEGTCVPPAPEELDVAKREGWIWLRDQAKTHP